MVGLLQDGKPTKRTIIDRKIPFEETCESVLMFPPPRGLSAYHHPTYFEIRLPPKKMNWKRFRGVSLEAGMYNVDTTRF